MKGESTTKTENRALHWFTVNNRVCAQGKTQSTKHNIQGMDSLNIDCTLHFLPYNKYVIYRSNGILKYKSDEKRYQTTEVKE